MRVLVNGVRLFFDVEGASLVPEGATMREKPTLVLLHGGPGLDHSIYKPSFSALADVAQVQWGDDVRGFCEALGIARPIVFGASFGGMVAIAYATRHPDHPAKLILVSTEAAGDTYFERRVALFERFGGPEVGALARRRFLDGHTDAATLDTWLRLAFPEVTHWFTRPGGEGHTFNLFPALSRVQCPSLVLGGEEDPMTPIECQAAIAAALPPNLVRFERFPGCGHAVLPDAPESAMTVIRDFIVH
jgi:pimeloyl-ACP methyl ester carboxylesterase